MSVPKNFRKNISLVKSLEGPARRQEILDGIADQGTYLPRAVGYEDMDSTFIDFVNEDLTIDIDGQKVPVIFLTLQRWKEFARTWKFSDLHKDIKLPFITIVRQPNPQVGTNQNNWYNIPARRNYVYMKVPTWDGNRKGMDIYTIPQPTSVDITYEVRMFTNRMRELNGFNENVQVEFNSIQYYIWPNGHPMPVTLESIGDESNISNFQERRFYVQPYEFKLAGYILRDEDMEVKPAINRALVMTELTGGGKPRIKIDNTDGKVTYDFKLDGAMTEFVVTTELDIDFTNLNIIIGISDLKIFINNVEQTVPFSVNNRTDIKFMITKDSMVDGRFILKGNTK